MKEINVRIELIWYFYRYDQVNLEQKPRLQNRIVQCLETKDKG